MFLAPVLLWAPIRTEAQSLPVFEDGMAQIVDTFANPDSWIREELWVETDFDSDGDGAMDRMHVSVTRQAQTESEGLKVAVIYGSSPYYSGVSMDEYFWDIRHEIGATPPERPHRPAFKPSIRPYISNGFTKYWVPRGFAVVHSESPGTGLSQGCPTVGAANESLAPKAVIDWLNGRAKGYTSVDGSEQVKANWCTGKVGMTGTSYNGTLPLAAATTGVEGLEA
ncbi:MAG: Xaa-Pro dipeptidyl-peptidase, partial [Bacteroidetes bacterium]